MSQPQITSPFQGMNSLLELTLSAPGLTLVPYLLCSFFGLGFGLIAARLFSECFLKLKFTWI